MIIEKSGPVQNPMYNISMQEEMNKKGDYNYTRAHNYNYGYNYYNNNIGGEYYYYK